MTEEIENEIDPIFEDIPEDHRSGFVAVVGRPNAGKSTLLNTFMAQKIAIVTPRPQTTRTRQLGILTTPTYQMIFMDTPGIIKKARHKLDEYMVQTALETFADADVILWVLDVTEKIGSEERLIAEQLTPFADHVILVLNKSDLISPDKVVPTTEAYGELLPAARWVFISALKKLGTDDLLQDTINTLPLGPRYYPPDQITDAYMRDIAAEMIREQVLLHVRDEIPHGVAVQVLEFKERKNGTVYISANIFIERKSHKRIIIGHKGQLIRQIGQDARLEIEKMLGQSVYIELWVKVVEKWRRREQALKQFGYIKR